MEGVDKRPFTDEELDFLTKWIDETPLFITPFPLFNERSKNATKKLLLREARLQRIPRDFRREKLVAFREYLKNTYLKGKTPYGHPVGKEAGTGIGEHTSQITLKLKGNTGTSASSKVLNMSQVFSKLLKASKTSIEFITIRFIKQWGFTDLYFNRLLFFAVGMKDAKFIKNVQYIYMNELEEVPTWYKIYEEIFNVQVPLENRCMRIIFDTVKLFAYHITLQDIVDKLLESGVGEYIVPVPSPQHLGIIDIFPGENYKSDLTAFQKLLLGQQVVFKAEKKKTKKKKTDEDEDDDVDEIEEPDENDDEEQNDEVEDDVEEKTEEELQNLAEEEERNAQDIYLQTKVRRVIDEMRFGNDNDVKTLSINWDNLSVMIKKEVMIEPQKYKIIFDQTSIREKSLHVKNFDNFFKKRGWTVTPADDGRILSNVTAGKTPRQVLRDATDNAVDFDDAVQPYIQVEGVLEDVITLPGIDLKTITSDSMVSMKKFFGIEVARNLLYQHIKDIFNALYPALLLLLTDFMTISGEVVSLDRNGIGKGNGPFTKSAFEEQKRSFILGAARPVEEPVSVTTSIFLGTTPALGTGVVEVYKNEAFQPPVKKEVIDTKELETLKSLVEQTDKILIENNNEPLIETISPEKTETIFQPPPRIVRRRKTNVLSKFNVRLEENDQEPPAPSNLAPPIIQLKLFTLDDDVSNDVDTIRPPVEETPVRKLLPVEEAKPIPTKPTVKKVVKKIVTKK